MLPVNFPWITRFGVSCRIECIRHRYVIRSDAWLQRGLVYSNQSSTRPLTSGAYGCTPVWKLTDDTLSICSDCLNLFLLVLSAFLSWFLPDFTIRFWCLSLWMSIRFVARVTRYSMGAKNRCGGKYNTGFITIFLRCIVAKNYPNWPRINKVIGKIKRVQFFWNTVYFSITIVPVNDGSRREWFSEDWCLLLYADIRADVSIWFCHPLVPICQ